MAIAWLLGTESQWNTHPVGSVLFDQTDLEGRVMDDYLFAGVCYVVLAYFLFGVVLLVRYGFN